MKTPAESETIMTEVILPNDTNPLGILMGGKMMQWMDIASAICAQKHSEKIAVTASVREINFFHPVKLGDFVTIKATVTRTFNTSMEIFVEVRARNVLHQNKDTLTNNAFFNFVALDDESKPTKVPILVPVSSEEQMRFEQALKRKKEKVLQSK